MSETYYEQLEGYTNNYKTVFADLRKLTKALKKLPKTGSVKYNGMDFKFIPLDDMVAKIDEFDEWILLQPLFTEDDIEYVKNILIHNSGIVLESGKFKLMFGQSTKMQDRGSVITYTRRYSLSSWLGVSSNTDTDGPQEAKAKQKADTAGLITPNQLETILKAIDNDVNKAKELCSLYGVKKLQALTMEQASSLILTLGQGK